ncbi:putative quinol monooxygenase [Rubellimicrobium aerolatum]|uniref:Quinol monooxygenase n=1 Tax=Rubellimicrobium aerolatum TaxID=490979 RepID=A0ABW0SA24_9RHOB|nr:putative quinol monooxygenase [Rubellimicrobium aerolatum]MBP1805149.1 quinol monooxygenase YgiN [Rubellimicrobium aerolatum]
MLVRLAEIEVDPENLERYLTLLREEIEASVANEPGVLALQAMALRDRPGCIRLLEVYADAGAYAAHLLSPHFLAYKAGAEGLVRSLRLTEVDPVLLRAQDGFGSAGGDRDEPG